MNEPHDHDTSPGDAPESPDTDAALLAELETLRNELDQLRATTLLERADLENQRKRVARDIEQARKFANERLLGDLLPVFDSLDAGLAAAGAEPNPLKDGLELTFKQLLKVAGDNGLALLDPTGEAFNPEHHRAISRRRPRRGAVQRRAGVPEGLRAQRPPAAPGPRGRGQARLNDLATALEPRHRTPISGPSTRLIAGYNISIR